MSTKENKATVSEAESPESESISPPEGKSKKRLFIGLGIVLVLVGVLFFVWQAQRQDGDYNTLVVKRQDLKEIVDVSGVVASEADVVLKAEISGQVLARKTPENTRVGLGTPLLSIDPAQYSLQLQQARVNTRVSEQQALTELSGAEKNLREIRQRKAANLQSLRNQLAKAEKNLIFLERELGRSRQLLQELVIPSQQYQQQEEQVRQARLDLKSALDNLKIAETDNTEVVTAQNRLSQAQTALNTARQQGQSNISLQRHTLTKTTVYAPFDGEITQWQIQKGDYVAPGTPLGRFQDTRDIRLKLGVNELDYPKIKPGDPVEIIFDALPDQPFVGKVSWMSQASTADAENIQVFPVKVRFDNPKQQIKPGMSGDAKITVATHKQVLAVPIGAVRKKEERFYVMRLKGDTPEEVTVVPGVATLDDIEIKTGLQAGDRLVVDAPDS